MKKNTPFPNIITEAGRAMSAHHAVLVTQIVDVEKYSNIISEDENRVLDEKKNHQVLFELYSLIE